MPEVKNKKEDAVLEFAAFILDTEINHPEECLIDYGRGRTETLSHIYARDPEQLKWRIEKRAELYLKLGLEVPNVG